MSRKNYTRLLGGAAAIALASGGAAWAQDANFNIAPQPLSTALNAFSEQSAHPVLFKSDMALNKTTAGVTGAADSEVALAQLLQGTGLGYRRAGDTFVIVQGGSDPQAPSAAQGGATVEALIVTAQKREEDIQDVPIAISAFSQEQLDAQKIEGGFDLLKAIPNVSFTKTNFTSYNFQIRGIGTQATSATTDPGVAVAFNNSGIIQNRLFEQEYLDVERVEVLRGPQGTLYGRNATAGVINVISAKPRMGEFLGELKGELANYNAVRLRGMVNVPLGDTLAVRGAAAWTDRDGYTFNAGTGHRIDGRDLWTGRVTIGWEPTPQLRADLIWEHFEEDDDRLRTGKQLCHRDAGPEVIGGVEVEEGVTADNPTHLRQDGMRSVEEAIAKRRAIFSQGCRPGSLFVDEAFGTPNGLAYPFILGDSLFTDLGNNIGQDPDTGLLLGRLDGAGRIDPYGGLMQSRDLREVYSPRDPVYRAKADLFELNIDFDLSDRLTFISQTAYVEDETYSFQDFSRFRSLPVFTDTSQMTPVGGRNYADLMPGGVYCDPQVGCSDTIAGFDIAQASAQQFNQEFRLQSSFEAPLNFSIGANYTKFETLIDYYVMFNLISAQAQTPLFDENPDPAICQNGFSWGAGTVPADDLFAHCPFVDPTPLDTSENFDGDGHNYFRSKNPYELESWATFGELYWNIQDDLKMTVGLRYTDDTKTFMQVPSQVLLASGFLGGGTVARDYPVAGVIEQNWGEWTGRLVLDWQPELDFTDETMIYGSFSRGYKGGGANPPKPGFADLEYLQELLVDGGVIGQEEFDLYVDLGALPVLRLTASEYPDTFEPEFVDAYEVGAKNTLLNGAMTFNATAFYYDYTDYQVSQIRDRTAVNENFDAEMWGLEFETMFAPSRDLRIIANVGYLNTQIADGETSIDIMNRTQSDPGYTLVKPWVQLPSNCVVPTHVAVSWLESQRNNLWSSMICGGLGGFLGLVAAFQNDLVIDPITGAPYDPLATDADGDLLYPEINGGAGLLADLSGNQLPNAPHWTTNIGAQYTFHLPNEWDLVVRGDAYWQSQSYHRVYNTEPYDKLRGWYNANLVVWAENRDLGWHVEAYVKNLLDKSPITGAFLNSDDTALTTNVFMLDPRLYGISVTKKF